MANEAAHAALLRQVALLRELPERLRVEAPPLVAAELDTIIRGNITKGIDPDGKPWAKTQLGKTPLRNAGKALSKKIIGTVILFKLSGPEALHHLGIAAGKIRRQLLPTKRVPRSMTQAIRRVLVKKFKQITAPQ